MIYSLKNDGDYYEKQYWNFLKSSFPNYEIFWRNFIVPLTKRAEGLGGELQKETDPLLENIAMAHYSVFYHLGVAIDLQTKLGQEFSEDILFHLSSATEMVERLIFALAKLKAELEKSVFVSPLSEDDILKRAKNYLSPKDDSKKYSEDFKKYIKKGQSASVPLHSIDEIARHFMKGVSESAENDLKKWQKVSNPIRHYRNTLAHNPKLGRRFTTKEEIYVPKENKLSEYELWSDVAKSSNINDFILLSELLSIFQKSLIEKTNSLWVYLIDFMQEISKAKGYAELAGGKPKSVFVDDSQPVQPYISPPSGTHYDPSKWL
jgi:hypothetical protein